DHPEALTSLKVCYEKNTDGNCGRCAKCLTSMLMLACVDALDACPFDEGLDPRALARLSRALVEQALPAIFRKEVLRTVRDPRLALALYAALLRWTAAEAVEQMRTEATSLKTALASRARQRPRSLHSRWPDATRSRPGGPPAGARAPAPR
ncbi:MAG TPA: hypothetical protein VEK76_00270, partial [Candidatus Binatia bacterium]|nr:hypothetical protein [Candidatus Binatia bacterium]